MPAYFERMPAGIPGDVTRKGDSVLESCAVGAAAVPYGAPVKLASGKLVAIAAGDAAAVLYGFLARPFPSQPAADGLGAGSAPAGSVRGVLRSGYMSVKLASGTAAKGGTVYVRIAVNGAKAVGDIETALVADETVAIPAAFMGEADSAGNVEIAYNI